MPEAAASASQAVKPIVEMVEALSNRQGELDIRLDRLSLRFPFGGEVELSGAVSVSLHLRELTDRERKARETRQLRALST